MKSIEITKITRWDILGYEYGISVSTLVRLNPNLIQHWTIEPGKIVNIPETEQIALSRTSRNLLEAKPLYPYE